MKQKPRKTSQRKQAGRKEQLAALKKESDLALRDLIRRPLAFPIEQRTHFLRKRVGFRASCL
jgi:hypothetical protein